MESLTGLEAKVVVDDTVITRRTREQGFNALGAWITFDGHFVKELAEREVITKWHCDIGCASCHHVSRHHCTGVLAAGF